MRSNARQEGGRGEEAVEPQRVPVPRDRAARRRQDLHLQELPRHRAQGHSCSSFNFYIHVLS